MQEQRVPKEPGKERSQQPTDKDLANRLSDTQAAVQAKTKDFESIFSALHACQADLQTANKAIKIKDAQIAHLKQEMEKLRAEEKDEGPLPGFHVAWFFLKHNKQGKGIRRSQSSQWAPADEELWAEI
ncbi:unnamed protein product [Durusdinium trenchii]|uniref:Uncharacterized protein n=1 Tax=Durusdinium trenchii TaxID=1381693 RepID=A0ABP0MK93_9DINO